MITFQTLEKTTTEELLKAFNLSFADYIVPLQLTQEQLEEKIQNDRIKLEFSVGAFEDNQLIAFILHGSDTIENLKVIYNAGTGVIPSKRGNKLTAKLYNFVLPILHQNNIDKVILEVISTNSIAINTYKKIGFNIIKEYECLKGSIEISKPNNDFTISDLKAYNWKLLQSFWDIQPSWQNAITAVEKSKKLNISIGVFDAEKLIGYAILNPKSKRLQQLSVDISYRRKGIATSLLEYISTNFGNEIVIINIDNTSKETVTYFTNRGFKNFVQQYEMELVLN